MDPERGGGRKELGGREGEGIIIRPYFLEKNLFSIKRREKKHKNKNNLYVQGLNYACDS